MNSNLPFTNYLVAEGLLPAQDLFLVDVGASGGIDPAWFAFQSHLRAVGFDPLVNEVARLNRQNQNPKLSYVDAFVVAKDYERRLGKQAKNSSLSRTDHSHSRSSSLRAEKLGRMDYQKEVFNSGQEMRFASRRLELDDYFQGAERQAIDFIKVDTDGSDYQVLLGGEQILRSGGALGLSIECQFHGPVHDEANLFCNIDRFLRARGFSLYDLETHRYSRAELPRPFVYDIPAQTTHGQVQWAEALYFRDLANPDYAGMWGVELGLAKRLKLAALFELFHLQDCAVELLLRERAAFERVLPVERCLDLLTPPYLGQRLRYHDYEAQFAYWAGRRQWHNFGRELAQAGHTPAAAEPQAQAAPAEFELGERMTHFLGREQPIQAEEVEQAQLLLNDLITCPDASKAIDALRRRRKVPPALRPVLLYHLGVAHKEGNALLAEVLELVYGRFKFNDCAYTHH